MPYRRRGYFCVVLMLWTMPTPSLIGGVNDSWKRHVDDDLAKKDTSQFRTAGQVQWRSRQVQIGDKGLLAYPVEIGKKVYGPKWKLHLKLSGEWRRSAAEFSIRFHMGRGAARVQLHAMQKGDRILETVRIMEETEHGLPYPVREETVSISKNNSPFQGDWVVAYNHGMVTLRRNGKSLLVGFVHLPDGSAPTATPLFQFELMQSAGVWRLDKLRFESTSPQFVPVERRDDQLLANRQEREAATHAANRRWYEALTAAEDSLRLRMKVWGRGHFEVANAFHQLGVVQHNLGRYREAKKLLAEADALWMRLFGADHPAAIRTAIALGRTSRRLGDNHAYFVSLEKAYRLSQNVYGGLHPVTANALYEMAEWYAERNAPVRARQLHEEAYAIRKRLLPLRAIGSWPKMDRRDALIDSLDALAKLDEQAGDLAAAETKFTQIVAIREQMHGPNATIVARSKRPLARLAKKRQLWLLAEQYERSELLTYQQEFGRDHPETAASMIALAETLFCKPKPTPSEIAEATALLRYGLRTQRAWTLKTAAVPDTPIRMACLEAYVNGLKIATTLAARDKIAAGLAYRYVFLGRHVPDLAAQWLADVNAAKGTANDVDALGRASHRLLLMAYEPFRPMDVREFPVLASDIESLQKRLKGKTPMRWEHSVADLQSLQKSLPERTALLDFASYVVSGAKGHDETRLAAFLVRRRQVECTDLGNIQAIEARRLVPQKLRALIWTPVAKHLGDVKLLFVAPNDVTSRLPESMFTDRSVTAVVLPQSKTAEQLVKAVRQPYPSAWSAWMSVELQTRVSETGADSPTPALRSKGFPIIPASIALVAAGLIAIGVGAISRRRRRIS